MPRICSPWSALPLQWSEMPDDEKAPPSFEAGLQELEQIVKEMESGDLPLERALGLFEKGMELSSNCRKQLEEAETRVEILVRRGERVTPEPFGNPNK